MEEKRVKPGGLCLEGVLMDKQNHPTFPYRSPKSFIHQIGKKKSSPAFANLWFLLVYGIWHTAQIIKAQVQLPVTPLPPHII